MRIEHWSVISTDRLTGRIYGRAGHFDGAVIVTSPVVAVRMIGGHDWASAYPAAFTESGSAYRLGRPAPSFPMKDAQTFICERLDTSNFPGTPLPTGHFQPNSTIIRAVMDVNLKHVEEIEVDATTFQPL